MSNTIRDVAKRARVSKSTVSLVLNDSSNVLPATREKVLKAVKDFKFHRRHSARSLVLAKGGSIGFLLTEQFFRVSETVYTRILLGAEFEAAQKGYYTIISRAKKPFSLRKDVPKFLLDGSVDGVIVAGKAPIELIKFLKEEKIPFVLVDFKIPFFEANHILIDNLNGSKEAVRHLISLGHSRIGFIGGSLMNYSIQERYDGYRQVMLEQDGSYMDELDKLSYLDEADASPVIGKEGALKLLKSDNSPTAIFACNDVTAIGCYRAAKELGLSIPDDIAIIGFDDIHNGLYLNPDLSSVHIYKAEMGKEAIKILVDVLKDPDQPLKTKIVKTKLIIRGSSGGKRTPEENYLG